MFRFQENGDEKIVFDLNALYTVLNSIPKRDLCSLSGITVPSQWQGGKKKRGEPTL